MCWAERCYGLRSPTSPLDVLDPHGPTFEQQMEAVSPILVTALAASEVGKDWYDQPQDGEVRRTLSYC